MTDVELLRSPASSTSPTLRRTAARRGRPGYLDQLVEVEAIAVVGPHRLRWDVLHRSLQLAAYDNEIGDPHVVGRQFVRARPRHCRAPDRARWQP